MAGVVVLLEAGLLLLLLGSPTLGSMDTDGDGAVSQQEISESRFFQQTDADGDGTIEPAEILDAMERFGVNDMFQGDSESMDRSVQQALQTLDRDSTLGVQGADLESHWNMLTSLVTPVEVAEWVANAVLLPQYYVSFRTNGVKGFDLPMFLEEPELLRELGVKNKLHVQQIVRSLSMRLLGVARLPDKPLLRCSRFGTTVSARWEMRPPTEADHSVLQPAVHRWRLFWRTSPHEPWVLVRELDGSLDRSDELVAEETNTLELRLEAWNMVGRSDYAFTTCSAPSLPSGSSSSSADGSIVAAVAGNDSKATQTEKVLGKTGAATLGVFGLADLDGDGDIDPVELQSFVTGLQDKAIDGKEAQTEANRAHIRAQDEFLQQKGVEIGLNMVDDNKDRKILPKELESHWQGMQRLMTVDRTVNWLVHAVEMPQYVETFAGHGITGFDFPSLVADDGAELRDRLGIQDEHDRHLLLRAITVLLLGIGRAPSATVHVSVRQGEECGSIHIDWSLTAQDRNRHDEMPVHKFRVLRKRVTNNHGSRSSSSSEGGSKDRSIAENAWVEVYQGMSTSLLDQKLPRRGSSYVYRIEAWNLLGVSPTYETLAVSPNEDACVSITAVVWNTAVSVLLLPVTLAGILVDNYYRITAVMSFTGFGLMFQHMEASEKKRVIRSVGDRLAPVLHSAFGSSLGIERVTRFLIRKVDTWSTANPGGESATGEQPDASNLASPRSPHNELISRVVEATFPQNRRRTKTPAARTFRTMGSAPPDLSNVRVGGSSARQQQLQQPAPMELGSGSPTSNGSSGTLDQGSKWRVVKTHVNVLRAVNAFSAIHRDSSDTDMSSVASGGAESPRTSSNKASRLLRRIKRSSKRDNSPKKDAQTLERTQSASQANPNSTFAHGGEASTKVCSLCGKKVKAMSRHTCGNCHLVYCNNCTAYKAHSRLTSCAVESRCICKQCCDD